VGFFWDWLNTHQWSYVTRADRRIEGWLRRNGWAEGWMPIYVLPASGRGFAFAKQGN
jgi:hypothetical protein